MDNSLYSINLHNTDGRLYIFSGHYGSGKSEVAVNFAFMLAGRSRTAIVDFDIINPYFRTANARAALENKGIRVITPVYANTNVDVPALPAEISSLFDDKGCKAVFDVGGDGAGAKAVSRYRDEFASERTVSYFVFNARRPTTSGPDGAIGIFHEIQDTARIPFTAIINNTNLMSDTDDAVLLDGLDMATALSERLSLPVAFSVCMDAGGGSSLARAGRSASNGDASGLALSGDASELASLYPGFFARSRELGIPVMIIKKHIHMLP